MERAPVTLSIALHSHAEKLHTSLNSFEATEPINELCDLLILFCLIAEVSVIRLKLSRMLTCLPDPFHPWVIETLKVTVILGNDIGSRGTPIRHYFVSTRLAERWNSFPTLRGLRSSSIQPVSSPP
jgi:hypothetical protein